MVKIIASKRGSGKSKKMIKIANDAVESCDGHIVFLDDDDRNMFDLKHDIRFINLSEYNVNTYDGFTGFLSGMISNDYDISIIYIDGLLKMVNLEIDELCNLINDIEKLSEQHEIDVYMAISHPITSLPSELEKYLYVG